MEFTLTKLLKLFYAATWELGMTDMEKVMNWLATELMENHSVTREDLKKEFDELEIPLWDATDQTIVEIDEEDDDDEDEDEDEDEDDEDRASLYGECGFRCDGHCQTCDPGYLERTLYGSYDHAGEI